jgi:hypothetical protein
MASLDAQIRFAIEHKRLLRLGYLGKVRVVEPHDYGVQKDREKLLVYQRYEVAVSSRPRTEGWRLLELPKFESCEVLDQTFPGSRGEAHQRHYTWDVLYARVK